MISLRRFAIEKIVRNRAIIMLIRRGPIGCPLQSLPLHQFAEKTVDVAVIDLVDRFLREWRGQEQCLDEATVIVGGCHREPRAPLLEPRFSELAKRRHLWLFFAGWRWRLGCGSGRIAQASGSPGNRAA